MTLFKQPELNNTDKNNPNLKNTFLKKIVSFLIISLKIDILC